MKGKVVSAVTPLLLITLATSAYGIDVTRPGDFVVASSGNHPAGEPPSAAIDNTAATKYLNFDRFNTGFTVTPSGMGVVRYLTLVTANDSPGRDPTSYTLEGSDDGVNFTPIASGNLTPPSTRYSLFTTAIPGNETTYAQYRVLFPTIRDNNSNSMQIGEVQLASAADITSAEDIVTVTYAKGASSPANEGPVNLFDNRVGAKFNVLNGANGPTVVNISPAVGPTVLSGFAYFSANDDVAFTGRTPQNITIEGSDDGVNYTPLITTPVTQATANYQDQEFAIENTTAYLQYRITFDVPHASTDMQIGEMQLFGVASDQPPSNDDCATPRTLGAGAVAGTTLNATGADITDCGGGDFADVWYSYTPSADGLVEVNTCGSNSDTTLAVFASCDGSAIACDDDSCALQSVVRWEATAGTTYLVRVALTDGATGAFRLTLDENPVVHTDVALPLPYNFNGMVHETESFDPDNADGYRAMSDRGLFLDGAPGALDAGAVVNAERLPYTIVRNPRELDILLVGDRNTVDGGGRMFDLKADGDEYGVQPAWLPSTDLTGPQTVNTLSVDAFMGPDTQIGMIYQISNGGGSLNVTLAFTDKSSVTVAIAGPDWFQDQNPPAPAAGVAVQRKFGVFRGAGQVDLGLLDNNLNVAEAIITTADLAADGFGDVNGKQLASVTFSDRSNTNASYAIFAATLRDPGTGEPPCRADFNSDGSVNSQDFFDFLTAFFANSPSADFNNDSTVNSQDFFDFIAAFFVGC